MKDHRISAFSQEMNCEINDAASEVWEALHQMQREITELQTRMRSQEEIANHGTYLIVGGAVIALLVTLIVWIELRVI